MRRALSFLLLGMLVVATTATAASKGEYERRMQSRISTYTPQCYADDPATAQREKIARWRRIVRELESIDPPAEIAQAHRRLTEVERIRLATLRKFLPHYQRLSQMIRRAEADGRYDNRESRRIANENQRLLIQSQPPRRAGRLNGLAFREFRAKKYDIEQPGPPKREYERRVQALVDRAGNPARSFRTTADAGDLRAQLFRVRTHTVAAARALGAITPRPDVINAQSELVSALCMRARTFAGFAKTLKRERDGRTIRIILQSAREHDRIHPFYRSAFEDYREDGYKLRPAKKPAG